MAINSVLAIITLLLIFSSSCTADNQLKTVNLTKLFNNSGQAAVGNNYTLYSQIINTTLGSNFHFTYVENNVTQATSILVVVNAGAYIGTSTLLNLFQGFGPVFQMNNQWQANTNGSWHQLSSNILYIESFYGAGFSWTDNQTMKSNVTTTQLGAEVLDALISWNLLYGTELSFTLYGEGYGAQLAIEIASMIVTDINYNSTLKPTFKGIMIGNGAFTTEDIPTWTNKHSFFYKNNLISELQFQALNECLTSPNSVQCSFAQEQATNNLFPGLNQYYIYDSCHYDGYPGITGNSQWNQENMYCINNQSTDALLQNYLENPIDTLLNVNISQVSLGNWTAFNPNVQNSANPLMNMTQNTLTRTLNMLWGLRNASIVIQFFSGDANIMFSYVDAKANIPQIPNINQINYSYFGSYVPYNPNDYIQPCLQVGGFVTQYDQNTSYYWVKHAGFFTAHDQYMAMYQVYGNFVASVTGTNPLPPISLPSSTQSKQIE